VPVVTARLDASGGPVVLGIDFGGTKVAIAVCDLAGRRLATEVIETRPHDGAAVVLGRGISTGQAVLEALGDDGRLVAVGVSTIGVPLEHSVELAPAIPGWEGLALGAAIKGAFGVPVRVATDVKAAAMAEACWGALAGADPAIYLNVGTGLAAAIVVGGRVLEGAHGASGEIGYNLLSPSHVAMQIGARPMLEDTVSGMGLAASGSRLLGHLVTARQVFCAAEAEPALDALVSTLIGELSAHLVNLVIAIDPARVAVGGGMARSWERLRGPLDEALKCGVPFPPELVLAAYPFDAPLVGALALGATAAGGRLPGGGGPPAG
jgi:glucokinase